MQFRDMGYSRVCKWCDDWVTSAEPFALIDEYDSKLWIAETRQLFIETTDPSEEEIKIFDSILFEFVQFKYQAALEEETKISSTVRDAIVTRLLSTQQTEQHSLDWLTERQRLLTASEYYYAINGSKARKDSVYKQKCEPPRTYPQRTVFVTPSEGKLNPTSWGHRFEPVARRLYELQVGGDTKTKDDMGRIVHMTLKNLAASPDGLVTAGHLKGTLIEIKCPVSRVLGPIPPEYWYQMQVQMEVTDTHAVDFVEVRFATVDKTKPWSEIEDIVTNGPLPRMGALVVVGRPNEYSTYRYIYSDLEAVTPTEAVYTAFQLWSPLLEENEVMLEKQIFHVNNWLNRKILRNRRWWQDVAQPGYDNFWIEFERYKNDVYPTVHAAKKICLIVEDVKVAVPVAETT